jgi:hypothetical protein
MGERQKQKIVRLKKIKWRKKNKKRTLVLMAFENECLPPLKGAGGCNLTRPEKSLQFILLILLLVYNNSFSIISFLKTYLFPPLANGGAGGCDSS